MTELGFREAQEARYLSGGEEAFREVEGRWRTYRRKASIVAAAMRSALPATDGSAIEVGCGSGLLTRLVAEAVPDRRLVGTDFSSVMLETARQVCAKCPNVDFRVQSIYDRFSPNGEFAFAFGCDIIHHLDDPVGAFRNLTAR